MFNKNNSFDVEYGHPSSYDLDDKIIHDHVPSSSVRLREDKPATTDSRLIQITRGCILLSALGLMVWGTATYTFPSSETWSVLERTASVKNAMSKTIYTSTTNVVIVDDIANNSAKGPILSFAGAENGTSLASLEARSFPPTVYCDINDDCDWGQICSDGICQSGCESTDDCRRPQKCKKGRCTYVEKPCQYYPCGRKCKQISHVCEKKNECCSRICRRSARDKDFKVCMAGSRRHADEIGNGDEEGNLEK